MSKNMHLQELDSLQEAIGYQFKDLSLLEQALTHSSYANERKINRIYDYERIEFLGDAVLELVTSDFFYHEFPSETEGKMTKLRASLVCEPSLAFCARSIGLEKYIRLGKGEDGTGGRQRDSIISDVFEAVIGAVYLDGGIEAARKHIQRFVLTDYQNKILFYDAKSSLQEMVQKAGLGSLHYELISESGPEHQKVFVVNAVLMEQVIGTGEGRSKKLAEQQAAYQAIINWQKEK